MHHSESDTLNYYHIRLTESPVKKDKWIKCEASVIAANGKTTNGRTMIYVARDSAADELKYGDLIYAHASFFDVPGPANPHEFDYKNYLAIHDIHHQAFIAKNEWKVVANNANPLLEFIYNTRNACNRALENSGMSLENIGVAKALILGDKVLIEDELMMSYAASGALHALAVSGLHVGIVMLILSFVLSPLKRLRRGKILFVVIALLGVWFYSIITGLSPSVLRAAVMFSFVIVGSELQRDNSIYQSLLVSAILILLIDPHALFKVGFLLSYLAVFGIVFFHPKISSLYQPRNFLLNKAWQITSVSIAAQVATFPIGIYCFQQFPNYFLLANFVVIPVSFVILVAGILYFFTVAIPYVSDFILFILDTCITVLNSTVKWVEALPYSVYWGISIQWYDVLILYAFIFSLTFAIMLRKKQLLLVSLCFFTLTVVTNSVEKNSIEDVNQVVFYSVKNEAAVDIFYGQEIYSLMSPDLRSDQAKLRYHIYPNRYAVSGYSQPDQLTPLDKEMHLLEISERKILFMNQQLADSSYAQQLPLTDAVYIHDLAFLDKEIIDNWIQRSTKIIAGYGVSWSLNNYLKKRAGDVCFYDLRKSGSLTIQF